LPRWLPLLSRIMNIILIIISGHAKKAASGNAS
jgi:hypothetical protein